MKRWFWKRWVWAVVVGITATVSLTPAQQGADVPSGPPKAGDVITLKFRDSADRQVKVLKSDKQPDGSYLSEVKDTKTGETFTLMDRFDGPAPKASDAPGKAAPGKFAPKASEPVRPPESPKTGDAPKAKPRSGDPLIPALKDTMPDPDKEKAKEQERERRILSSFGKSSPTGAQEEERPGLLKRIFGKKPAPPAPTTSAKPAAPAAAVPTPIPSAPAIAPPVVTIPAAPPAPVRPAPAPAPTAPAPLPPSGVTMEPPLSQPVRPVTPPTPVIPTPVAPPTGPVGAPPLPIAPPAATSPVPLPAIPSVPPVPVPAPTGLPSIPVPGVSKATPGAEPLPPQPPVVQTAATAAENKVVPAAEPTPAPVAEVSPLVREIQSDVADLETGLAPSKRAMAARCLAGGRHGSSDEVKAALFRAAKSDGSGMVRAVCIEELCKLGFHDPAFMSFLGKAGSDPSEEVRAAAKAALTRMAPRR